MSTFTRQTGDEFLTEMTKMFNKSKTAGSVFITMKRYRAQKPKAKGQKSTWNKNPKKKGTAKKAKAPIEHEDPVCLIRTQFGKRKATTTVPPSDSTKFARSYAMILRVHTDGLKEEESARKKQKQDPKKKQKKKLGANDQGKEKK